MTATTSTAPLSTDMPKDEQTTSSELASGDADSRISFVSTCQDDIGLGDAMRGLADCLETFVMDADGGAKEQLTTRGLMSIPSPDGTRVAFYERYDDSEWELFVADADYTNAMRIVSTDDRFTPAWSPDGTQFALIQGIDDDYEILIGAADGSDLRRLTRNDGFDDLISSYWGAPLWGSWSPDSTRLAFSRDLGDSFMDASGNYIDNFVKIVVISIDGADEQHLVTGTESQDFNPSWSPDGTKIAYFSFQDEQVFVSVIGTDGASPLHAAAYDDILQPFAPAWSPDSSRIAFWGELGDGYVIAVAEADGSGLYHIAESDSISSTQLPLFWSPDGTQIAFADIRDGDAEIFVVDTDGTNIRQLTDNDTHDWPISWQ